MNRRWSPWCVSSRICQDVLHGHLHSDDSDPALLVSILHRKTAWRKISPLVPRFTDSSHHRFFGCKPCPTQHRQVGFTALVGVRAAPKDLCCQHKGKNCHILRHPKRQTQASAEHCLPLETSPTNTRPKSGWTTYTHTPHSHQDFFSSNPLPLP